MAKAKSGLALLLGVPKKGPGDGPDDVNDSAPSSSEDFEQAAVDAFPDMEGKPERIAALKQAIQACIDDSQ